MASMALGDDAPRGKPLLGGRCRSRAGRGDYFANGKRWRVRLHEKGGKQHEMPAHHKLEAFLDEWPTETGTRRRRAPALSHQAKNSPAAAVLTAGDSNRAEDARGRAQQRSLVWCGSHLLAAENAKMRGSEHLGNVGLEVHAMKSIRTVGILSSTALISALSLTMPQVTLAQTGLSSSSPPDAALASPRDAQTYWNAERLKSARPKASRRNN